MWARIIVTLKKSVHDPKGQAIVGGLQSLNFLNISDVRQGKVFDITFNADSIEKGRDILEDICEKLLVNSVVEDYEILDIKN